MVVANDDMHTIQKTLLNTKEKHECVQSIILVMWINLQPLMEIKKIEFSNIWMIVIRHAGPEHHSGSDQRSHI